MNITKGSIVSSINIINIAFMNMPASNWSKATGNNTNNTHVSTPYVGTEAFLANQK